MFIHVEFKCRDDDDSDGGKFTKDWLLSLRSKCTACMLLSHPAQWARVAVHALSRTHVLTIPTGYPPSRVTDCRPIILLYTLRRRLDLSSASTMRVTQRHEAGNFATTLSQISMHGAVVVRHAKSMKTALLPTDHLSHLLQHRSAYLLH